MYICKYLSLSLYVCRYRYRYRYRTRDRHTKANRIRYRYGYSFRSSFLFLAGENMESQTRGTRTNIRKHSFSRIHTSTRISPSSYPSQLGC